MSEEGAISLLRRAVDLDNKKRWTEALICYKEGLHLLMEVLKECKDDKKKGAFREKASDYMTRAETLQTRIDQQKKSGQFHEQLRISSDSTGHSYERLFGRFLDDQVTKVEVEDPYIRSHHQIMNFVRLCELLVKRCSNLSHLTLLTTLETSDSSKEEQMAKLKELQGDLLNRKVRLQVDYSDTLHDREIRLSSGWRIKIGRGLDLYKAPKGRAVLGVFDLELRPCHETTVDIFHGSHMVKKS